MIQFDQYFWDGLVQPPATSDISQVFVPFISDLNGPREQDGPAVYRAYGTWEIPKIFVRNHQTQRWRPGWTGFVEEFCQGIHTKLANSDAQWFDLFFSYWKPRYWGFLLLRWVSKNLHESCPAVTTVDLNPAKLDSKTENWRNQWPHLISEHGLLGCARKLVNG